MEYRVCQECGVEKPLVDYHKNNKGEFRRRCRSCRNAEFARKREEKKLNIDYSKTKVCDNCGISKSLSDFSNIPYGDGTSRCCLECSRAKSLIKRQGNPGCYAKMSEASKLHYIANREKRIAETTQYRKDNPQVNKAAQDKWRRSNLDKDAAKSARRRAKKTEATPCWAGNEWEQFLIDEMYHLSRLRKEMTGIEHNVDHIVPLQSDIVCGLHCAANLRVITGVENSSKGNRYWPDMP